MCLFAICLSSTLNSTLKGLFYCILYPQSPKLCLIYSGYPRHICWKNEWIIDKCFMLSIALMTSVRLKCRFWLNQYEMPQHFILFRIIFSELNLAWILRQKATFCFLSGPISFHINIHFGASIVLWTLLLQSPLFGLHQHRIPWN